jgi:pyruvate carboxylase
VAAAEKIGYPVLIKATGGGGGMGIYKCFTPEEVRTALPLAISQGKKSFANGDVFVEKFIQSAKHIEIQVCAGVSPSQPKANANDGHVYITSCATVAVYHWKHSSLYT